MITTAATVFPKRNTALKNRLALMPAWAWLLIVAVPLRFLNLGMESFWYDETFTAWVAKLPLGRMFQAIRGDVHPPLFYMLEWVVAHTLGDSEYALRLQAAVFGTVAVLLLWQVAREIGFDIRTAFVAGLIAAVLPGTLYYSQEARMYALLLCALLGMVLAGYREQWRIYLLCAIVAIYSQNLGLVSVAAINLGVLGSRCLQLRGQRWPVIRSTLSRPLLAMVVMVICWLPWSVMELAQASQMGNGFWLNALTVPDLLEPLTKLTMGERAAPSIAIGGYAVAIALTVIGLWAGRRWVLTPRGIIIVALLLGVPAMLAAVSWGWRSVYLPRAMIGPIYMVCLLWAWLLCNLPKPDRRTVQIVLVPVLSACLIAHYAPNQTDRPPWRDNVKVITSGWQPGDVIYFGSINAAIAVGYYTQGYPYALRHTPGDLNQSMTPETQAAFGFTEAEFDTLIAHEYRRAWLIVGINPLSSSDEIAEIHRILATYPNTKVRSFLNDPLGEESIYLVNLDVRP